MSRKTYKPHSSNLRQGRYSQAGQIYHITATTHKRKPIFTELVTGRFLVRAMMEDLATETMAYVLMPDHFHWLIQLHEKADLTSSVSRVKSVSAHRINKYLGVKSATVWQKGFYDHALRKEEDIVHVARYIVANPLRAGLVKSLSDYSFWDAIWV